MMRVLKMVMMVAVAITAGACNGDSTGGSGEASITGRYGLQSVNGTALPATIAQEVGYRLEVTSGDIQLNSDGTYSSSIGLRETEGTAVTTDAANDVGVYVRNNAAIAFTSTIDQSVMNGAISGNTLTVPVDGYVFVFRK